MDKGIEPKFDIMKLTMNPSLNAEYMKDALFLHKFSEYKYQSVKKISHAYQNAFYKGITIKQGGLKYMSLLCNKINLESELADIILKSKLAQNDLDELKANDNIYFFNFRTIEEEISYLNIRRELFEWSEKQYNDELLKLENRKKEMESNKKMIEDKINRICGLDASRQFVNKNLDIIGYTQEITRYDALICEADKMILRCLKMVGKFEYKRKQAVDDEKILVLSNEIKKLINKKYNIQTLKGLMMRLRDSAVDRFAEIEYEMGDKCR